MREAWNTLMDCGLPDGAARRRPTAIDFAQVRAALTAIDPGALDDIARVVLLAWLDGWCRFWPRRFARELGATGARLLEALRSRPFDANRYLKLRRIAAENLSAVL